MNDVLLTVSGIIPDDIEKNVASGQRPEADYLAMARVFQADLIDYARARQMVGGPGRFLEKLGGPDLTLAWACFLLRKKYRLIFADGEQIGILLALFLKFFSWGQRPLHFMIGHILSVRKKMLFFDLFRIHTHIDRFFVYASSQKNFIQERWKVPAGRVILSSFMVDHHFFSAANARPGDPLHLQIDTRPIICSVGLEFRDYETFVEAVRGLDVTVVIAAASPWSKRKNNLQGSELPENICIQKFSQYDLRDLYAASRFVVMPLFPVNFQAGVTAILEAMAMGKTVISSRTPGQTDVIVDGQNGLYVPPQDPAALRDAIQKLLNDDDLAKQYGEAGRQLIEERMSLDQYTEFLNGFVKNELTVGA